MAHLGGTFGDKAEVTNHECQQRWHELGSVVQRESVRTRRESQPDVGERGSWEEMEPICSTLAVEEKSERDLEVIWLNEEGRCGPNVS